jgi:alanine racemase
MKKGDSVSYSRRYILSEDANIISIPLGYADGINRRLTNKMKALIGGEIFEQAGTVTMDRIMFNTGSKKFSPGEKVILLGEDKNHKIDAWTWSDLLDTIPYEITCGISKRVPRYYVR